MPLPATISCLSFVYLKNILKEFIFIYVYMCHVCSYGGLWWSEEGVGSPGPGLQVVVNCLMWELRIELRSSTKAVSNLTSEPYLQPQRINILKCLFSYCFFVAGDQSQVLYILGKRFTTAPHPQPVSTSVTNTFFNFLQEL